MIVNAVECGTREGLWIRRDDDIAGQKLGERIIGRLAASPVIHPQTGEVIVERDEEIDEDKIDLIDAAGVNDGYVRSPMTCELPYGICAKCYGRGFGAQRLVSVGAAVGIIAAQSMASRVRS
jgi:DNA-directed RNA polymerase subunit beta'